MFVNNFKINLKTINSGTTATTINIPISMVYQPNDNTDLINNDFVTTAIEENINPIIDYDFIKYTPINNNGIIINNSLFKLTMNDGLTYGDIGFTNNEIKTKQNVYTKSFINLSFYDSDNPLTQNLISNITLYPHLYPDDLNQNSGVLGIPKPANQILLNFLRTNPLNKTGISEGFFLYHNKITTPTSLYMRASFKNAKTGKSTNLMTSNVALPIDDLVNNLYVKYDLNKTNNLHTYKVDNTYSNNVNFIGDYMVIKLYEILAI